MLLTAEAPVPVRCYPSIEAAAADHLSGPRVPVIGAPGHPLLIGPLIGPGGSCPACLLEALKDAGLWPLGGSSPAAFEARPLGILDPLLQPLLERIQSGPAGLLYTVSADGQVRSAHNNQKRCRACIAPQRPWQPDGHQPLQRGALPSLPEDRLVNSLLGPLLNLQTHAELPDPLTVATAQLAAHGARQRVYGVGREARPRQARTVAMLEALERAAGLQNRSGVPRQQATLHGLRGRVLNPHRLGLYQKAQYRRPAFPCRPFDTDEVRPWVQGYSLSRQQPVWIEESLVFYDVDQPDPLVVNNSNGCAVGSSREEAVLYGLLELFERDGALRWWRAGRTGTRVALRLTGSSAHVAEQLLDRSYDLRAYDTTRWGIPSVVLVGIDPGHPRRPYTAGFASAAALTLDSAITKAIPELSSVLCAREQWSVQERAQALDLSEHPWQVQTLDDHLLACSGEAARQRFSAVLTDTPERRPSPDVPATVLSELLQMLKEHQLEVMAVDQTTPLHEHLGLHCVRVLVPGLLALSYGAGLERCDPLGTPWINRTPHPFS